MAGLFENLLSGGVTLAGGIDQINRTEQLGKDTVTAANALGTEVNQMSQFKPFGVTSSIANTQVGPDGSIDYGVDPALELMSQGRFTEANNLFGRAAESPELATQGMFSQMQAAMQPQMERDRLAQEARMRAQGRLGVGSNMYGGLSPEGFKLGYAQQEAMNNAYMQARGMANTEAAQAGNLATNAQNAGFQPTQIAANLMSPAVQTSNLAQTGQLTGANAYGQMGITGLEAQVNTQKLANEMYGGLFSNAASLAGGAGSWVDENGAELWETIKGWL